MYCYFDGSESLQLYALDRKDPNSSCQVTIRILLDRSWVVADDAVAFWVGWAMELALARANRILNSIPFNPMSGQFDQFIDSFKDTRYVLQITLTWRHSYLCSLLRRSRCFPSHDRFYVTLYLWFFFRGYEFSKWPFFRSFWTQR